LCRISTRNGLTLWKVFNDFDKKKGSLTLAEFTLLIRKISSGSNDISEEEIRCGFELIDEDNSNSI
jgi:Ca2+-binding EF-hand superfamily protein